MIKRQDITPPWIEKQQELVRAANTFRSRLRSDWRRHAARTIASRGGSLDDQVRRAERLAAAEEAHNPRRRNVDQIAVPSNATDDPVMVKIRQQVVAELEAELEGSTAASTTASGSATSGHVPVPEGPLPPPLRDPDWERAERSYMELAVNNLNAITRSYNLMAPDLAKKPYFSLERELAACFADVAPQLAATVRERATRPARPLSAAGDGSASVLDRLVGEVGPAARVHDSKAPHYGFKDFWRDVFGGKEQ